MSHRERAINLINQMDDGKVLFVVNILEGINGLTEKSEAYDLELAMDSEVDNDKEYTSEEVRKILGLAQ